MDGGNFAVVFRKPHFAAPEAALSRYSGSPAGVNQGTIAKWLFHQEKATLNSVRNGS